MQVIDFTGGAERNRTAGLVIANVGIDLVSRPHPSASFPKTSHFIPELRKTAQNFLRNLCSRLFNNG